jgi:sugar phosphate isomerase/epimerase
MPRTIALYSGSWPDRPLAELASKASDWGYQALELECIGDHCSPHRAVEEEGYLPELVRLLEAQELRVAALSCQTAGQLLTDPASAECQSDWPAQSAPDADADACRQEAARQLLAAAQTAQRLGTGVLVTACGCPLPASVFFSTQHGLPRYQAFLQQLAQHWAAVLDELSGLDVRLAFLVQPGQAVWDAFSAELFLEALGWRSQVGLALDTGAMYWHGAEPAEFIRRFADRIVHVRVSDVAVRLTGGNSVLSPLPSGDPRRGWDWRSPGHGQIDFESVLRALHDIGYTGALSVAWIDPHMHPEFGAADACQFLKRLDFPTRQEFPES